MEIKARVERFEAQSRFLGYGYIRIMFYGTMSYDKEFRLEVDFDQDGNFRRDSGIRDTKGFNEIEKTPRFMVDTGKVYEKVLLLQGDKAKELFNKASDISKAFMNFLSESNSEISKVNKEVDEKFEVLDNLQKQYKRLRREDKKRVLEQKIDVVKKERQDAMHKLETLEQAIDMMEDNKDNGIKNILVEL